MLTPVLTPAQHQSKLQSVSAVAKKVLEAVPIADAWSRAQIRDELRRMTTSAIDGRTVDGCLSALETAGLVRQHPPHHFTQIRPHEKAEKPQKAKGEAYAQSPETPPTGTEILARQAEVEKRGPVFTLAEPVRAAAKREDLLERLLTLSDRLVETAAELESIRKQIRAELETADAKVVKLEQLTALLDSLRP